MRRGRTGWFISALVIAVALSMAWPGAIGCPGAPVRASGSEEGPPLSAVLDGRQLALKEVASYHCHDREFPKIRCFRDDRARDNDLQNEGLGASPDAVSYVLAFWDANYGGASFAASMAYPNLGVIGWNDAITSFKSLNGGRPRFYRDAGLAGVSWRWATRAWVPNVGSAANDEFSSVENDP
jgi:hypothetical protein